VMDVVLRVFGGLFALNVFLLAILLVKAAVAAAAQRRGRRRSIRDLEAVWRMEERSPHVLSRRPAASTPGHRRAGLPAARTAARPSVDIGPTGTSMPRSHPRQRERLVRTAVVAAIVFAGIAFGSPRAHRAFTSMLGTVAGALGLGHNQPAARQAATDPRSEQSASAGSVPGPSSAGSDTRSTHTRRAPPSPTTVTAVSVSPSEIELHWTNVPNETGYRIEHSLDAATGWTTIAITGPDVTTYTDEGLSSGTTYFYRVFATNAGGDSPALEVPSATTVNVPPSPTTVTAVPASSTQIELDWSDVPDETGYRVERSPDGSTGWATVATTGQDVTTYLDSGLASGTTYYYRVFATSAGGDSSASGTASATTAAVPPSPTFTTALPASSTQIELDWSDVPDETGYRVERSADGSTGWVTVATTGQDVTTYLDGGLASSTTYYYRVFATSAGGDSPASGTASATTTADPPSPTTVTAVPASSTTIELGWTDVSGETGYRVERSADGSTEWITVAAIGQDVTTYVDSGLASDTTYYYRVFATNFGGDSPASDPASATTSLS
jgi:fibronectin type 3 domain-containing protein